MSEKKEMTVKEIKETLDGFGIEYDDKLKKKELLKILHAETTETEKSEEEDIQESEPQKKYDVLQDWKDLIDGGVIYIKGDIYPKTDTIPSEERIEQLSTTNNKIGKVLIKERS